MRMRSPRSYISRTLPAESSGRSSVSAVTDVMLASAAARGGVPERGPAPPPPATITSLRGFTRRAKLARRCCIIRPRRDRVSRRRSEEGRPDGTVHRDGRRDAHARRTRAHAPRAPLGPAGRPFGGAARPRRRRRGAGAPGHARPGLRAPHPGPRRRRRRRKRLGPGRPAGPTGHLTRRRRRRAGLRDGGERRRADRRQPGAGLHQPLHRDRREPGHCAGRVDLSLAGLSADGRPLTLAAARPAAHGNRAVYRRGDVSEWYANGPLGLEQGFTIAPRAAAAAHHRWPSRSAWLPAPASPCAPAGGGVDVMAGARGARAMTA